MDHDLSLSKLRPAEPRGSIYADEYLTEESGDEGDSPRLVAKKIKKLGYRKKKYKVITNKMREELIDAIENNNEKIKDAAKRLRMDYSSAKSILQVYKKEGRLNKKGFRRKSGVKNEFSEDYDEEEGEFVEKVEFIKEESSATISRKEIVPVEESEDEVQPPQKPVERSKVAQLTPKQTTPEKQVSPKAQAPQETINPISLFQQQQSQFNYSLNNTNLSHLNFFPSAAASSMKTNFANNSYFPPNSFSSLPFAGTNFQGAFPSKDNFAFKTSNLVGGLQQKPAQRNFNSLTGTNLYQENPVFMQNLIQTNFFPSQYIAAAAGNRYWNPLIIGGNQLVRPASNQLVGNFGVNPEVQLPKVEDFDI